MFASGVQSQGVGRSTENAKERSCKAALLNRTSDRRYFQPLTLVGSAGTAHTKSAHCRLSRVGTYAGSAVSFPGWEARLTTKRS